jgi:hypothetical protein
MPKPMLSPPDKPKNGFFTQLSSGFISIMNWLLSFTRIPSVPIQLKTLNHLDELAILLSKTSQNLNNINYTKLLSAGHAQISQVINTLQNDQSLIKKISHNPNTSASQAHQAQIILAKISSALTILEQLKHEEKNAFISQLDLTKKLLNFKSLNYHDIFALNDQKTNQTNSPPPESNTIFLDKTADVPLGVIESLAVAFYTKDKTNTLKVYIQGQEYPRPPQLDYLES